MKNFFIIQFSDVTENFFHKSFFFFIFPFSAWRKLAVGEVKKFPQMFKNEFMSSYNCIFVHFLFIWEFLLLIKNDSIIFRKLYLCFVNIFSNSKQSWTQNKKKNKKVFMWMKSWNKHEQEEYAWTVFNKTTSLFLLSCKELEFSSEKTWCMDCRCNIYPP